MSKAAVRQKRGGTLSRTSSLIEDTLKQVGKKQKLFMEEHVCTIFRITLNQNEQFSNTTALSLIDKYRSKRQAHCTGRFLEDRMSLVSSKISGKAPFRSWIGYREIESIYISKNKPEFFVLCINSETSNQRYYEIYKCKDSKRTSRVERLLKRAFGDPDKIIRDMKSMREVSCTDLDRVRSLSTFELLQDSEPEDEVVNSVVNGESSPIKATEVPTQEAAPIMPDMETEALIQNAAPTSPIDHTGMSIENIKDLGEITYIAFDPIKGPVVNDVGPIYLFSSTSPSRNYETKELDLDEPVVIRCATQPQPTDYSQSTDNSLANAQKASNLDLRNTETVKHASSIEDDLEVEKSRSLKIRGLKSSNVTSDSEDSVVDSFTAEQAVYNGFQAA